MNSQPARFGELFSSAWAQFKERQSLIFSGAAIFTVISLLTQIPFVNAGDAATAEMGMAIVLGIVGALVGIIAGLYFLILVVRKETSVGAVFSQVWPRILPFIGLSLLTMIKTYAWVALLGGLVMAGSMWNAMLMPLGMLLLAVGIVCGIIFGPRYISASILWLVEGKSVRASVDRSYQITTGYWGKIVGNMILAVIIFMAVMIVTGIVSGIIGGLAGAAAGEMGRFAITLLITGFVSNSLSAFMNAFLLKLTATMVTNPRTGSASSAPAAPVAPTPVKKALKKPQATVKKAVKKAPAKKPAAKKKA